MTNVEAIPAEIYEEATLSTISTEKLITELKKREERGSMRYKLLGKKQLGVRMRTRVARYSLRSGLRKSLVRRVIDWLKNLFIFSGGVSCFLFISAAAGFEPSQRVFYKVVGG